MGSSIKDVRSKIAFFNLHPPTCDPKFTPLLSGFSWSLKPDVLYRSSLWVGPLADGSKAVLAFNRNNNNVKTILVPFKDLGWQLTSRVNVRDLWLHEDLGEFQGNYIAHDIESHGVQMLKMALITL